MLCRDGFVTLPWSQPYPVDLSLLDFSPMKFFPRGLFHVQIIPLSPTPDNFLFGLYSLSLLVCLTSDFSPTNFSPHGLVPPFLV